MAAYIRQNFKALRTKITDAVDLLYSLKANPNAAIVDCLKLVFDSDLRGAKLKSSKNMTL